MLFESLLSRRKILSFQNNARGNAVAWMNGHVFISSLVSHSFSELYFVWLRAPLVFICVRTVVNPLGATEEGQIPEWCDRHHHQRFTFPLEISVTPSFCSCIVWNHTYHSVNHQESRKETICSLQRRKLQLPSNCHCVTWRLCSQTNKTHKPS